MKTFFSKVKTVGLDDGDFFEDDNATGLWDFDEHEWDSFKGECGRNWGGGISGGFRWSVNESEKYTWRDEDWENDTCEVNLWTIHFDLQCRMWADVGDGRNADVDERTECKDASICGREDEPALDSKVLLLILCLKLTNIYNFFTTFSKIWIKKYTHIYIIELKK